MNEIDLDILGNIIDDLPDMPVEDKSDEFVDIVFWE